MKKLLLFIVLLSPIALYSQATFDNPSRANYILNLSKYVQWPNINDIDTFNIGILDNSDEFYQVLTTEAEKLKLLQNKVIKIKLFNSIEQISPVQVIYVHKKNNFEIFSILEKIKGNHTLLMSENYPYHQSMLNFIVFNNIRRYELNEKRLQEAGLSVPRLFIAQAVNNETDWQKIYDETEKALQEEKKVVAQQKVEIQEQQKQIDDQKVVITEQLNQIHEQEKKLARLEADINRKQAMLRDKIRLLEEKEKDIVIKEEAIKEKNKEILKQNDILEDQKKNIEKQLEKIDIQENKINKQLAEIEKQRALILMAVLLILMLAGLGYFIYHAYKIKKQANIELEEKNRKITEQKEKIEKQNKNIMDSINYAKRIQHAILPNVSEIEDVISNFFILWRPKDVVSGDFYWHNKVGDNIIIVAADCTGHGVPGAFMSMLGVTFLNDIVIRKQIVQPSEILNNLRDNIISALNQRDQSAQQMQVRDGMDISVCVINYKTGVIQFAGANNPLLLIRNNELEVVKADKMPVAIYEKMISFTNQEITLKPGDCMYIFSDGYADQFGGEKGRKFMMKQLKETLIDIHDRIPMKEQKEYLNNVFEDWKGHEEQIDDVLLIGIRV